MKSILRRHTREVERMNRFERRLAVTRRLRKMFPDYTGHISLLNTSLLIMKEFDYELDYKRLDFTDEETRKLYRIGRGEQGVLLVRPYTNLICAHWRFVNEDIARKSANKIYSMFCDYKEQQDFIGMDMARKFLEMGFTRSRRYANHPSGKKYARDGSVSPQSPTALHCEKSRSASVFKQMRDKAAYDEKYVTMRKIWRSQE